MNKLNKILLNKILSPSPIRKDYAIWYFGGVGLLARELGITGPAVSSWGEFVPAKWVAQIQAVMDEDAASAA